ncbi:MAG: hypothetical protein M3014_01965 [Chloroflexota bacterium]|nr:hypothetical protein [Chloroflexota bacterium]
MMNHDNASTDSMNNDSPTAPQSKGPVTNCVQCDKWIPGPGPTLCAECQAQGYDMCHNCGRRVADGTTPYCDQCAEEIVGTG